MESEIDLLIVDDNKDTADALHDRLIFQGYKSEIVFDGQAAVEYMQRKVPDLVILDLMMPKRDGYSVLNWIRNNPSTKDLVVIVSSAKDKLQDINTLDGLGADGYVAKPYHLSDLLTQIKTCLSDRRNRSLNLEKAKTDALKKQFDPKIS